MTAFRKFVEADMPGMGGGGIASPVPGMGGGAPGGMPGMGGPPGMPPAPPMGGMGGIGGGSDPLAGGMGGGMGGGAAAGMQAPMQIKFSTVWDVLEKLLNNKPLEGDKQQNPGVHK